MRKKFNLEVKIPEEISCEFADGNFICRKGNSEIKRFIWMPRTKIKLENDKIIFSCEKANKKDISMIKSNVAHLKNLFIGLNDKFTYEMEICNVHFPMNVKVQNDMLIINNFLGEKSDRKAKIIEGVNVEIKGNNVIITSADLEKAGQTAANIEKASRVAKKDRRIFQDGIFITLKPGRKY